MANYTGKLPIELIEALSKTAEIHQVPENKIIEKALSLYLEQINRVEA
ncbi:hypothetical protein LB467_04695 [Salegentibacter sp. JZCK2]|nr:hypothetical protein [Salegentibacter tibetensis]MBZ9728975.1 hypothetical protein [Salegentibacter tibetensis]